MNAALAFLAILPWSGLEAQPTTSLAAAVDPAETAPAASAPVESVVSGRKALSPRWPSSFPWYDLPTDDVRRVELPKPWAPATAPTFNWSWLPSAMEWLAWIVIGLLLVALIALLLRTYLRFRASRANETAVDGADEDATEGDRVEALPFPVRRSGAGLLDQARECYERGDYGQAIIYLFSYELVQLDKGQIIRLAKGKTNRQYLREVGPRQALRAMLDQTMVAFEDVFFGNHALERARFESIWSRVDEFLTLARERAT